MFDTCQLPPLLNVTHILKEVLFQICGIIVTLGNPIIAKLIHLPLMLLEILLQQHNTLLSQFHLRFAILIRFHLYLLLLLLIPSSHCNHLLLLSLKNFRFLPSSPQPRRFYQQYYLNYPNPCLL